MLLLRRGIDINYDKAMSLIRFGLDKGNDCLFLMGRTLNHDNTNNYDFAISKEYYRSTLEKCSDK